MSAEFPVPTAAIPSHIKLEMGRYLRLRPVVLLPAVIGAAVMVMILLVFRSAWGSAAAILGVLTSAFVARTAVARFGFGELCAGCVVSSSPLMVACFTDLSTGVSGRSFHVVTIRRVRAIMLSDPRNVRMGDLCVMAAFYHGRMMSPHWSSYSPEPLRMATSDEAVVKSAEERVPESVWNRLSAALEQTPRPPRPGVYRVLLDDESGWPPGSAGTRL